MRRRLGGLGGRGLLLALECFRPSPPGPPHLWVTDPSPAACSRWKRRRPRASLGAAAAGPGAWLASAQGASRLRVSEPSVSRSLVLSAGQGPAGTLRERGTVVRPRLGSRAGPSGVAYKASCALAAPRCPRPRGPRLLSARRGAGARRRGRAPAWEAQSAEARLALRVGV